MASVNARRIARLEQGRAVAVPNVVEVATAETEGEALARFAAKHGRSAGNVIVMPSRATDDELADLEPMWADQQRRLIADARDARKLKEGNDNGHDHAKRNTRRNAGSRRILSASGASDTTRVAAWKPG